MYPSFGIESYLSLFTEEHQILVICIPVNKFYL